jgi:hypothetical protein
VPVTKQTWSRLKPAQKAGLIIAALVLPCCGGVAVIGAIAGDDGGAEAPAGQVRQLADRASAAPSASTGGPVTQQRTITETEPIKFKSRTIKDNWLPKGEKEQRTAGIDGVRTLTYSVTVVDGRETARKLVKSEVTRKPVAQVIAVGTAVASADDSGADDDGGGGCAPGYEPCVPVASDVDCAGGSGNGPAYVQGPVTVTGSDPYDLDRDGDGTACD